MRVKYLVLFALTAIFAGVVLASSPGANANLRRPHPLHQGSILCDLVNRSHSHKQYRSMS